MPYEIGGRMSMRLLPALGLALATLAPAAALAGDRTVIVLTPPMPVVTTPGATIPPPIPPAYPPPAVAPLPLPPPPPVVTYFTPPQAFPVIVPGPHPAGR